MIEAAWLALATLALFSREARVFVVVLLAKWFAAYGVVWVSGGIILAYASTALMDVLVLVLLAPVYHHWRWSFTVWLGQISAVCVQAVFWTAHLSGHHYGIAAHHAFQAVFTIQLIAASWPTWGHLGRVFRRCTSRRVRLLVRAFNRVGH